MSRIETSENIGPNPFRSIEGATSPTHGPTVETGNYTKHGYQVACSNLGSSTNLAFYIFAKNELNNKWQKIAGYAISNTRNNNGILYFDCWNFKYAKAAVIGTFDGASITVIEKHNA